MLKFATIAIVLFVAVAAEDAFPGEEESQLSLMTTNDAEVAGLVTEEQQLFRDFCITSRDSVFNDIKKNSDLFSSRVFAMFFDSAENLGRDIIEVSKVGAERLGNQLANPESPIADATNDAEQIIAQGQQNIQGIQTQPMAFIEAFKTSVKAISTTVGNTFAQKVDDLKKLKDISIVADTFKKACAAIDFYENENIRLFEKTRSDLAAANEAIGAMTINEVPCTTARRVSRLDGLCKLVGVASGPFSKIAATFIQSRAQ